MSVYAASGVTASVAYGENFDFVQDQFKTVPYDYQFTILEQNGDAIFWSLTQSFDGVTAIQTYTTYGTGTLRDGKLDLVGTGKFPAILPIGPVQIETDFIVTQNITGRVGSRHARLSIQETGTLRQILIDDQSIPTTIIATYSLQAGPFCADRVVLTDP